MGRKSASWRLPSDTHTQIDNLAKALGMTKTQVLVIAIREFFKREIKMGESKGK